jgi:hypothetical protein
MTNPSVTQAGLVDSRPQLVGCVGEKDSLASCTMTGKTLADDGAPGFLYVLDTYGKGSSCLRQHTAAREGPCGLDWPKLSHIRVPNKERTRSDENPTVPRTRRLHRPRIQGQEPVIAPMQGEGEGGGDKARHAVHPVKPQSKSMQQDTHRGSQFSRRSSRSSGHREDQFSGKGGGLSTRRPTCLPRHTRLLTDSDSTSPLVLEPTSAIIPSYGLILAIRSTTLRFRHPPMVMACPPQPVH